MNGCALQANKNIIEEKIPIKLSKIDLEDSKIDSLVNTIIEQNQEYLEKGCFILVGINRKSEHNSTEVIIIPYEKEKFKLSCPKNDYPIIGYAEIKQQIILFIGEICNEKMKITEIKKEFAFSCRQDGKNHPPSMYNPTIHKFILKNNGEIKYTLDK